MDVDGQETEDQPGPSGANANAGSQEGEEEADLAARRAEAEAGIASLQQKKQPTKVSQKKVDQVKVKCCHNSVSVMKCTRTQDDAKFRLGIYIFALRTSIW